MQNWIQSVSGNRRGVVLVIAFLALLTVFVLAVGLESVELRPAEAFVTDETDGGRPASAVIVSSLASMDPAMQVIVVLVVIGLFVLLFILTFRKDPRRALVLLLRFAIQVLLVYYVLTQFQRVARPMESTGDPAPAAGGMAVDGTPAVYVQPEMPQWFVFTVSFVALVLVGLAAWWVWRLLRPPEPTLQEDLRRIANRTLHDLEHGHDWGDAVIRCYAEMSEALDRRRGIARRQSMTPSEFISQLDKFGLPGEAVRTLTRLFERVRYGGRSSSAEEAAEAARCLNQIVDACGGAA